MKKIKNIFLIFLLIIFKYHLKFIYFFIKLFTIQRKRVFLLSRQSDTIPLNYELIIEKLKKERISYVTICKKVPNSINIIIRNEKKTINLLKQIIKIFQYYFNLYKQMYYAATSKVIITDGYNLVISILKHKKETKVIQLWHALAAIKKFGYQTMGNKVGINSKVAKILCMHKNYDYVISGSTEMNKYFAEAFDVDINKVLDFGTPTIDYLLNNRNDEVVNKLYKKYPKLKTKKNVLYSPTFRNDGSNKNDEVINNFDYEHFNLIITFHQKNKNNIHNKNIITINRNEFLTYDVMRVCDYIITDYSALAIDACVLNKKVLLYVYDYDKYKKENGLNVDLFKELEGNVSKDFKEIMNIIKNSYNVLSLKKFREKYVSNLKGDSTRRIVKLIKENL